jgi:hypothetical protein
MNVNSAADVPNTGSRCQLPEAARINSEQRKDVMKRSL